jgi:anti-anti-sigma factor
VTLCEDGLTVVVSVQGELDISTSPLLRGVLDSLLPDRPGYVIIDMSATGFCDVSGTRLLDDTQAALRAAGGVMAVAGARGVVARVLQLLWRGRVPMYESVASALRGVTRTPPRPPALSPRHVRSALSHRARPSPRDGPARPGVSEAAERPALHVLLKRSEVLLKRSERLRAGAAVNVRRLERTVRVSYDTMAEIHENLALLHEQLLRRPAPGRCGPGDPSCSAQSHRDEAERLRVRSAACDRNSPAH